VHSHRGAGRFVHPRWGLGLRDIFESSWYGGRFSDDLFGINHIN